MEKRIFKFLFFVAIFTSCTSTPVTPTITDTITPAITPSKTIAIPTPTLIFMMPPTSRPTILPTLTPMLQLEPGESVTLSIESLDGNPEIQINPDGPWVFFITNNDFLLANADGSGLFKIPELAKGDSGIVSVSVASPKNGQLAVIQQAQSEFRLFTLNVSTGELTYITPLWYTQDQLTIMYTDAYYSVVSSLAWSHSGEQLAYSALPGQDPNIFVYDFISQVSKQISSEPESGLEPVWSPDDHFLVFSGVEETNYESNGDGYSGITHWAVNMSQENPTPYDIDKYLSYSRETILNWPNNNTYLTDTLKWYFGYHNLRTVNVQTGSVQPIFCGGYIERDYDLVSGKVLLFHQNSMEMADQIESLCTQDLETGYYLVSPQSDFLVQKINQLPNPEAEGYGANTFITWREDQAFFEVEIDDQYYRVSLTGEVQSLPESERIEKHPCRRNGNIDWLLVPNSSAFFCYGDNQILYFQNAESPGVVLAEEVFTLYAGWINP